MNRSEYNQCYFCETDRPHNERFYCFFYYSYGYTDLICPECLLVNVPNANWKAQHACIFCSKEKPYTEDLTEKEIMDRFLSIVIVSNYDNQKTESATICCKECFDQNIGLDISKEKEGYMGKKRRW